VNEVCRMYVPMWSEDAVVKSHEICVLMLHDPYSKKSAPEKRLVETNNVELHAHMQGSCDLVHEKDKYYDKFACNAYL